MSHTLTYDDLRRPIDPTHRHRAMTGSAVQDQLYDSPLECTPLNMPTTEVLVTSPEDLFELFRERLERAPELRRDFQTIIDGTGSTYWRDLLAGLHGATEQPATVPAGVLAADAYTLRKAVVAVRSLPPPAGARAPNAADLNALTRLLERIGIRGTLAYHGYIRGRFSIVFKGYPGLRSALRGTVYAASDARIVNVGIGIKGLEHVARNGAMLAIVTTIGIEVVGYLLHDERTMSHLIGGIGVELAKAGVAIGLGVLAGTAAASVATGAVFLAVAPLGAMIAMSFVVGLGLNWLDREFNVKRRVIAALDHLPARLEAGYYKLENGVATRLEQIHEAYERSVADLRRQALNAASQTARLALDAAIRAAQERAIAEIQRLLQPSLPRMR